MQVYENSNKIGLKTTLLFLVILFVAYLPITSFHFFLKNDAFNGYFPAKFFMSESINAGQLPLWNPYINFGIPQYGDMNSGYWSPLTWLIAYTTGYNAYTFTIELIAYIFLAGLGMYKLLGIWKIDAKVKLIAGVAFMCNGYIIGHLQHFNWISGTAFLPWCLWAYLKATERFSFRTGIRAALIFYLLIASAHPGIIIGAFYFFFAITVFKFYSKASFSMVHLKQFGKIHGLIFCALLMLCVGVISGYLDIIPFFSRGEKLSIANTLSGSTTIQSWISTLLPLSSVKGENFFNTELTVRNCYFSLLLLLFFIYSMLSNKNRWHFFFLFAGLFFVLLSSGGIFKIVAHKILPGISYVRLNGEFRIFSLMCFIIISAISLNSWFKETMNVKLFDKIYLALKIILSALLFFGLYKVIADKESFIFSWKEIIAEKSFIQRIKHLIDTITFFDAIWIQAIAQLIFLKIIKYNLYNKKKSVVTAIVIIEIIFATLLNIPFTGVGKTSLSAVQSVIEKAPTGIPLPPLHPIKNNDTLNLFQNELIGDWSMYNKQIGTDNRIPYPINLKNTDDYFKHREIDSSLSVSNLPYLFLGEGARNTTGEFSVNDGAGKIKVIQFSPNSITIDADIHAAVDIIYLQNYYPHWYYMTGTEKHPVLKAGINFMQAPLQEGKNTISFKFEPRLIQYCMIFSAIVFLLLIFYLLFTGFRQHYLSKH